MEEVYLVRHGSVENPKGVVYRREDGFPLSELGLAEAREAADFLIGKGVQIIFHSPLQRCVQTVSVIQSALNVVAVESPEINEWGENESLRDVQARMNTFWMTLYAQPYEKICIVSHRDPLRSLMLGLAGRKLSDVFKLDSFAFEPASIWLLKAGSEGTEFENVFKPTPRE